jgi:surface carbohydrate biosynthesis protein
MNILVLSMVPQRDWVIDEMIVRELNSRTRIVRATDPKGKDKEVKAHNAVLRNYLQDGREAVIAEKPDVVIMPVIRCEYSRDFAQRLKDWGIKVIARRSEAGVSKKAFSQLAPHWQLDQIGRYDYKELIDMELVWSQEFADILVDNNKVRADQVRIIGGITLDPYFHDNLVEENEKELKAGKDEWLSRYGFKPGKKTLLFCTGFVNADKHGYCLPEAPDGDPIHAELQQRDFNLREMWVDTIASMGKKYNILIRPHPGEDGEIYSSLENAAVSRQDDARECLFYADCMIHSGSTLAVPAHILNKPAFCLGSTAQDELIRDVSPFCEDKDALITSLKTVEWGKSNALIDSFEDLKKHFYGPIDGKAHIRCADAVCEFDFDINVKPPQRCIPPSWPAELHDYTTPGMVKLEKYPVISCGACKNLMQNTTGQAAVRCPHCGIMTTQNYKQVGA